MNLFENLVDELKEENLLEETVILKSKESVVLEPESEDDSDSTPELENSAGETPVSTEVDETQPEDLDQVDLPEEEDLSPELDLEECHEEISTIDSESIENSSESDIDAPTSDLPDENGEVIETEAAEAAETETTVDSGESKIAEKPAMSGKEAYSKRMREEVLSLDAVEHVVSGIEREQMRTVPHRHDVVPVKQALHLFLTEFKDLDSPEPTESEATLRKEIEKWHTSLIKRDADIPTPLLRLYCEESNLNSRSLGALVRFYRNSPFSENVRSKFDLVITRYFAEETDGNCRELNLEREVLISTLTKLYEDWASVPVYALDDEDSELILAAFKFEDFINEAKKCRSFDELLTNGFFKRIKRFKKKTSENFFAPMLVASAVECNVAIGNRYVELIDQERQKSGADILGNRYGGKHDKSVSEATSKTLQLSDLLKEKQTERRKEARSGKIGRIVDGLNPKKSADKQSISLYSLVMSILAVAGLLVCGYLTYTALVGDTVVLTDSEEKFRLERSFLHKYVKNSTIKDNTFSGVVTGDWNALSREEKEEVVSKISALGKVKGYEKVELKDDSGKVISSTLGAKVDFSE